MMYSQAMNKLNESIATTDTKTMILDAAEALMADHGIAGVSLRSILSKAGANTAALHYHFGTREGVVKAVLARRGRTQTLRRLEMLERLERNSEPPAIMDIVEIIVDPMVELLYAEGERGRRFIRFLARLQSDRSPLLHEAEAELVPHLRARLANLVVRACPHLPAAGLQRRMMMALDTTLLALANADVMSEAWTADEHTEALLEYVVTLKRFLVGGLSAQNL